MINAVLFDSGKNMAGAVHVLLDGVGCDAVVTDRIGIELTMSRPTSVPT